MRQGRDIATIQADADKADAARERLREAIRMHKERAHRASLLTFLVDQIKRSSTAQGKAHPLPYPHLSGSNGLWRSGAMPTPMVSVSSSLNRRAVLERLTLDFNPMQRHHGGIE